MFAIGTLIRGRTWAIRPWLAAVEEACEKAEIDDPLHLFVIDRTDEAYPLVAAECRRQHRNHQFIFMQDDLIKPYIEHAWTDDRIAWMALLRNVLLRRVRTYEPELFLSLDSDIFLHPDALSYLVSTIQDYDAVGGKCYMSDGRRAPSYAMMPQETLLRPDSNEVLTVDCIMAMKLMTPKAYAVDYSFHRHGEDIAWSLACKQAGLTLGWDGRVTSKHCMSPSAALRPDERCGF